MDKEQATEQAKMLSERHGIVWCVIDRGDRFSLKMYDGVIQGQRRGVDYSESQIVWKAEVAQ